MQEAFSFKKIDEISSKILVALSTKGGLVQEKILGKFLAFLGRKTHLELDRILKPLQVDSSTYRVLVKTYRQPGITQIQIAQAFNIDKASISRAVSKLIKQKYLTRKKATADKRNYSLFLTNSGRSITLQVINNMHKWQKQVLKNFSEQEQEQLFTFLQRMSENIQNIEKQNAGT